MLTKLQKLKGTKAYGALMLAAMVLFFYAVFKILTPDNFGSPANLYSYLQSSIIYSVGCPSTSAISALWWGASAAAC